MFYYVLLLLCDIVIIKEYEIDLETLKSKTMLYLVFR